MDLRDLIERNTLRDDDQDIEEDQRGHDGPILFPIQRDCEVEEWLSRLQNVLKRFGPVVTHDSS